MSFDLLSEIRKKLKQFEVADTPQIPPDEPPIRRWYSVDWQPATPAEEALPVTLEHARQQMAQVIADYTNGTPDHILLIAAKWGIGKTHQILNIMQQMGDEGKRVGLFMDRHKLYEALQKFAHFNQAQWYHWLALHAKDPGGATNNDTMCLLANEAATWTNKGYPLMELCQSICQPCGLMSTCSYRNQTKRKEPCIAGVHEHSVYGMGIDYHSVFIDEMPLRPFVRLRHIPQKNIYLESGGPVHDLLKKLQQLSEMMGKGKSLRGKPLLDLIGRDLENVFIQVDEIGEWLPVIPRLDRPSDVNEADYWYLADMLLLLGKELACWEAGWDNWLSRVVVSSTGIDLLMKSSVWNKMPSRVIITDATANPAIYESLFERPVQVWTPNIKRIGRIHQVASRLNGIKTIVTDGKLSDRGQEVIDFCKEVIRARGYKNPGAICFKATIPELKLIFGDNVVHFYGQRGTNQLKECDAVFVVGCPSPPDASIINTFAALYPDCMEPVEPKRLETGIRPVRTTKLCEYHYTNEKGESPRRMVSGFWWEPELQQVYEIFRENELEQAAHRARPLTRDCDVWLLTSVATGLQLDGFYEDETGAIGCPDGISWQLWAKLRPWLDKMHQEGNSPTIASIAEVAGVGEAWVSRKKWLQAIIDYQPHRWEPGSLNRVKIISPIA